MRLSTFLCMDCWASSLGDCGGGPSGEHVVSKALFSDGIHVRGLPWCRDDIRSVGLNAVVVNNACVTHNTEMSPFDAAVRSFQEQVDEMVERVEGPLEDPIPTQRELTLRLADIEAWFLKTVVNVLCVTEKGEFRVGDFGASPGVVPEQIVQRVFRGQLLGGSLGLHIVGRRGANFIREKDKVLDLTFVNADTPEREVAGAVARLVGVEFVLWLDARHPPPFDSLMRDGEIRLTHENSIYVVRSVYS